MHSSFCSRHVFPKSQVYTALNSCLCEVLVWQSVCQNTGVLMWYVAACRALEVQLLEVLFGFRKPLENRHYSPSYIKLQIVLQVAGQRYAKSNFTYHAKDDEGF